MAKIKHTVINDDKFLCLHCGGEFKIEIPIHVDELIKKIKSFNALHGDCKKEVKPVIP